MQILTGQTEQQADGEVGEELAFKYQASRKYSFDFFSPSNSSSSLLTNKVP